MQMKQIPNILTVSRIVYIIIFIILATLADRPYLRNDDYVFAIRLGAYVLAALASLTDLLDGYLARRYHATSDFGALMDPLADKIFVTAAMLMAIEYRLMPAIVVFAVLMREFMVTGLRALAAKKQVVIAADRWGKLKTAMQMVMLGIAGVAWFSVGGIEYLRSAYFFIGVNDHSIPIRLWFVWLGFLWIIVLVTILSGIGYFVRYRFLYLEKKEKK